MPRKRKAARTFRRPNQLSDAQKQTLLFGYPITEPMPGEALFQTEVEQAAAWRANRAALMNEFTHPGRRPWGFWKYDLGRAEVPMQWWEETAELERLGLLARDEEIRIERERVSLAADQSPELYGALFNRPWDEYMYRSFEGEFTFAAGWHARRNRPALAAKYEKLAATAKKERSNGNTVTE